MSIRAFATVAAFVAALSASAADDLPFVPVVTGDSWKYSVTRNGEATVTSYLEVPGKGLTGKLLVVTFNPNVPSDRYISDVLLVLEPDDCLWDPFLRVVLRGGALCARAPVDGEVWSRGAKDGPSRITGTILGYEDIVVPAGAFHAMKFKITVEMARRDGSPNIRVHSTNWYAKQVKAIVRIDSEATTPDGKQTFHAILEASPGR